MSNSSVLNLTDSFTCKDNISRKSGFYARTKIIGGYDPFVDKRGITRFGEKLFETENMIVLGGSLFTLEKVFGCQPIELDNTSLNELMNIATGGSDPINKNTDVSYLDSDEVVCLFGVGIGGAGESSTDVANVHYHDRNVFDMIPLRRTSNELTESESKKYWFKKEETMNNVSKTNYYLKTFESKPRIKVLWESGEEDEDGIAVNKSELYTSKDDMGNEILIQTHIETFIELTLKISKKDVREYFEDAGEIEQTRVNTIGLFSGIKTDVSTGGNRVEDYKRVRLFSKLNINNEMLTLPKDLTIVYRIYTS